MRDALILKASDRDGDGVADSVLSRQRRRDGL